MNAFRISALQRFNYRHSRMIHGIRIAVAFVLTFIVTNLCGLPDKTWVFITVIVLIDPVVFLGNVWARSTQRILGTLIGAAASLIGLYFQTLSIDLIYFWCAVVMFISGYYTLSQRAYAALVIGTTLAVVIGAPHGDINTALYRILDVMVGTALSLLFSIILPQRAFTHWCLDLLQVLTDLQQLSRSSQVLSVAQSSEQLQKIYKLQPLLVPATLEQKLPTASLKEINLLCHRLSSELIHLKQQIDQGTPPQQQLWLPLLSCCIQPLIEQLQTAIFYDHPNDSAVEKGHNELLTLLDRLPHKDLRLDEPALLNRYRWSIEELQQTSLKLSGKLTTLFAQ